MANQEQNCTWNLVNGSTTALLTFNKQSGVWKLEPTDSNFVPIVLKEINNDYQLLYAEAVRIISTLRNFDLGNPTLWEEQTSKLQSATSITIANTFGSDLVLQPTDDTAYLFNEAIACLTALLNDNLNQYG